MNQIERYLDQVAAQSDDLTDRIQEFIEQEQQQQGTPSGV